MRLHPALLLALLASAALAAIPLTPRPMKQSPEEIAFNAEIEKQGAASNRLILARNYLERYPNDIALAQAGADVILNSSMSKGEAADYLQKFAEAHSREFAPQYAYAYAADDTLIWAQKAQWALRRDSTNFWAWLMWANAEWRKQNADLDTVVARLGKAISLDPSRPEAYLDLGDVYMQQGDWEHAVEAYKAGLVADSISNILRLRIEDANDRVRRKTDEK